MPYKDPVEQKEYNRLRMQRYRATHPEYVKQERERFKLWKKANPKYQSEWQKANPGKIKEYEQRARELCPTRRADTVRKCKYGITREEFDKMIQAQNGLCAICQQPFIKTPCVDHNHATGENRDLLCHPCNHGIGNFKDNPDILSKAILYLQKHSLVS
jgi:hypothetical protein